MSNLQISQIVLIVAMALIALVIIVGLLLIVRNLKSQAAEKEEEIPEDFDDFEDDEDAIPFDDEIPDEGNSEGIGSSSFSLEGLSSDLKDDDSSTIIRELDGYYDDDPKPEKKRLSFRRGK